MVFVSVKLSDGLGNRFFQVAAMLGYAERHGHTPVFVSEWIQPNTTHPGPKTIQDYFPAIQVLPCAAGQEWTVLTLNGDDSLTYIDLPYVATSVCLSGYFQSPRYFPSGGPAVPAILLAAAPAAMPTASPRAFLHVRRGDYLHPLCKHHQVDLRNYYRYALSVFDPSTSIVVCSDDIAWCRATLPHEYRDIVDASRWIFLADDLDDYETLRVMVGCSAGGICANSTFSWWATHFGRLAGNGDGMYCMPGTWGYPPLPPARDIYPDWATVLPI
jgi:hypothetical protein